MNAKFSGKPSVTWLNDGRTVKLLRPFSFTDSAGVVWQASKGDKVDGSSIPKLFWSIIGSPFVGKHRLASVIHDKYCVLREKSGRTSAAVHKMYYEACLCAGVGKLVAKTMYLALKIGAPRWKL